jgi:hypothetical protein
MASVFMEAKSNARAPRDGRPKGCCLNEQEVICSSGGLDRRIDRIFDHFVGGSGRKSAKGLDMPDIVVLRVDAEVLHGHVCDRAAAKIAAGLVSHRRLLF